MSVSGYKSEKLKTVGAIVYILVRSAHSQATDAYLGLKCFFFFCNVIKYNEENKFNDSINDMLSVLHTFQ